MSTLPVSGPKFRELDANGNPLSGGKLYSYAAGTTTPQDTFTTRAGNIANTNPVILNANGEADVWTTEGVLYKFVLKDSADVIRWTVDNFPSGQQTAASADITATVDPGGRLTLTSGTPVTTSDVSAATTIFYTPFKHTRLHLYDGVGTWTLTTFAEISQALSDATKSPAATIANHNYDLFVWLDAGTLRLSRGPPWTANTSRGTGAGTTELIQVDGRYLNANAISNGPGVKLGTYVGTFRSNTDAKAYDTRQQRFLWNTYNRVERAMLATDPASTWTYTNENWRQANNNIANQLDFIFGLAIEAVQAVVEGAVTATSAVSGGSAGVISSIVPTGLLRADLVGLEGVGIGVDSTVNSAGVTSFAQFEATNVRTRAEYTGVLGIGLHFLKWLERGRGDTFTYQQLDTVDDGMGGTTDVTQTYTLTQHATWYGTITQTGMVTPTSLPVPYTGSITHYTETVNRSGIWGHCFA